MSIEYFFNSNNDIFGIAANTNLYATNTTPVITTDYDYILTFQGQLDNYFSAKNYQQDTGNINSTINIPYSSSLNTINSITDNTSASRIGSCVVVSNDNSTMAIGGSGNDSSKGAIWIFIRSGSNWIQQQKITVSDAIAPSTIGYTLSLSNDGNTLAFGSNTDNGNIGATWVWIRTGTSWAQQAKLIATDAIGNAGQGCSISLSGDGNILAVGGSGDDSNRGSCWIWTRTNSIWLNQTKLHGNNFIGLPFQGGTVVLSNDGLTLAIGGSNDNTAKGAIWIFTGSNSSWTQQTKIILTNFNDLTESNFALSLSSDGNTLAIGMYTDNSGIGACWIWTRTSSVWSQQAKLISTNIIGTTPLQGSSVSLTSNGNVLAVGSKGDNGNIGATFIWLRTGTNWVEQEKIVCPNYTGTSIQGFSISLSGNGTILAIGGYGDNSNVGKVWIYSITLPSINFALSGTGIDNYIVNLTLDTNVFNGNDTTGYNNIIIMGGKTSVQNLGMTGLVSGLDFNTRVLEILAIKIFGHARARAAISNDTNIIANIKSDLSNHIQNMLNLHKNDIFNQYVQTDNPNLNTNDINANVNFNFANDTFSFPGYIVGSLIDVNNLSVNLLAGPNVGGNIMVNGNYNVPILIRIGN